MPLSGGCPLGFAWGWSGFVGGWAGGTRGRSENCTFLLRAPLSRAGAPKRLALVVGATFRGRPYDALSERRMRQIRMCGVRRVVGNGATSVELRHQHRRKRPLPASVKACPRNARGDHRRRRVYALNNYSTGFAGTGSSGLSTGASGLDLHDDVLVAVAAAVLHKDESGNEA
jgi:hypothetical protein